MATITHPDLEVHRMATKELPPDQEDKLQDILADLRKEPNACWAPEDAKRLISAANMYRDGLVSYDTETGTYYVISRSEKNKVYKIVNDCTCDAATKSGKSGWCAHRVATVIYRKMHATFPTHPAQPSLLDTRSVDERLAATPQAPAGMDSNDDGGWPPEAALQDARHDQEAQGDTIMPDVIEPEPVAVGAAPEASRGLEEASVSTAVVPEDLPQQAMDARRVEVSQARAVMPVVRDAEGLIALAIEKNVNVEMLERLLAMRRELKAEFAKEAFDAAMAAFQAECPVITKTKTVKTDNGDVAYKYAPLEHIVQQVKGPLSTHGFSYTTDQPDAKPGYVKAVVKVKHVSGHTEVTSVELPLGNKTRVMSATQVEGAALTFCQRRAFCNAFGILTGDEDTDGRSQAVDRGTSREHTRQTPDMTTPRPSGTEPTAQEVKTQKDLIRQLVKDLGFAGSSVEDVQQFLKEKTGLTPVEANYETIIDRLRRLTPSKN